MGWKRARSPEQKEERRRAILAATAELLDSHRVDELSLNQIARHCGLAKSNVYRYFGSREEILLALVSDDLADWVASADQSLSGLTDTPTPERLAGVLVDNIMERPRLIRLLGQLTSVIEKNITAERLLTFKLGLRDLALAHSASLSKAVPWLDPMTAFHLAMYETVLVQALWPIHSPPQVVKEVMDHPDLCMLNVPFKDALVGFLTPTLRGFQVGAPAEK